MNHVKPDLPLTSLQCYPPASLCSLYFPAPFLSLHQIQLYWPFFKKCFSDSQAELVWLGTIIVIFVTIFKVKELQPQKHIKVHRCSRSLLYFPLIWKTLTWSFITWSLHLFLRTNAWPFPTSIKSEFILLTHFLSTVQYHTFLSFYNCKFINF